MNVTVVGPHWRARWTDSVQRALVELGHSATVIEYPEPTLIRSPHLLPGWVRRPLKSLLQAPLTRRRQAGYRTIAHELLLHVQATQSELVLLLRAEVIAPATVEELKRVHGIQVVTWWIDDPFRFPAALAIGRHTDYFFVFSRHCERLLHDIGIAGARYLPCAFDPLLYRPLTLSVDQQESLGSPLSFVGTYYPQRGVILEALADLSPAVWGPGWSAALARGDVALPPGAVRGDDLTPDMMARVLNATRVSLDIHHPQSRHGGLNMRAFEAAACGTFQLVDLIPDADDLFEPGEEVVYYRDVADLRRLLAHYLAHPEEAAAIAVRAQARAMAEHTFRHRVQTLLDTVLRTGA